MLRLKDPVLILPDGAELSFSPTLTEPRALWRSIVVTTFTHYIQSHPIMKAYELTAKACGYKSHATVIKIVGEFGRN